MFERFTSEAREAIVRAQAEARQLGHERIGTEHLLLGLLSQTGSVTAAALSRYDVYHRTVLDAVRRLVPRSDEDMDAAALHTIGIDLAVVRDRVEATFGPGALDRGSARARAGHILFSARAKKCLELSLREAIALRHKYIGDGHLLLGILREGQGLGALVLSEAGVDLDALRRDVIAALPARRTA